MSFFKNITIEEPTKVEGSETQVIVSSTALESILFDILKELKIMNFHLSFVTDMNITKQEVE